MGDAHPQPDPDALPGRLRGLLECPVTANGDEDALQPVAETLREALPADAVALVSRALPPPGCVLAAAGLAPDEVDALRDDAPGLVRMATEGRADAVAAGLGVTCARVVPGSMGDVALVVLSRSPRAADVDALGATLTDVAAQRVGAALELARLRGDLDRAMAQILESDERMLGRIGLDIHDGPTQHLSVALLEIQLLEADLGDAAAQGTDLPPSLLPSLERIYETLGGALTEMRELIGHLRPAQFENRRLTDILQDAITGFEARSGASVTADMTGEFPVNGVSVTQRITFYRILQEALNNAHRHGHARNVHVRVDEAEDGITLEVSDDGKGFDADGALRPRTGAPIARFGLHGMRDRASVLGGGFAVRSAPGEGTTVRVFLPRWRPPGEGSPEQRG